ncbi:TonB-dependent receptor plug domain-containing protein [Sandarakinorhabdus rubra]|uniref:TonB-dependent receptor plug domain-containing protein n=1 Tax=Sandarakinorhabdus rubra TaxID=2672568 RepID=UPI0013D9B039|nr:TonB-dependent receptor [Sandarakinorhabdus rubra]
MPRGRVFPGPSLLAAGLLAACPASAQTVEAAMPLALPDEAFITVTAPVLPGRVATPLVGLKAEALLDRQPRSIGDALRGLPGVAIRTNSRGETSPRVRGGEERQTLVFLDGAPLAVPWDGRIDLGLIPAGIIGSLSVRKGAGAIEYGANAVAGAVDLQSRRSGAVAQAQAGPFGMANLSGAAALSLGDLDVTLGVAHQAQDALVVARTSALPFSQPPGRRRFNTDLSATSLFGAVGGRAGGLTWRASLLHIDARRGIAPESDRDPAVNAPRYWRYPDWQLTQAQAALELPVGGATARVVAWRQWFGQAILAYRDASYTSLRAREDNDDDTAGARLTLTHAAGPATLRWSLSHSQADHLQTDTQFPAGVPGPVLRYRQTLSSGGVEADVPLGARTGLTLGLGLDRSSNPITGDKPAQPARQAATFSAALKTRLSDTLVLSLSGGRRNRFASARELFGEALGRFAPNPELAPEQVWLADAELVWRTTRLTLTVNPFWTRATGSIGQRLLVVDGRTLRQRFNQGPATSFGLDAALQLPLAAGITLEMTGSALHAEADGQPLPQRPFHEAMLAIDWAPGEAFDARIEARHIGPARDLGPDGRLARLPPATEFNLRTRLPLTRIAGARLSLIGAIDNIGNAVTFTQLGLPLPGRTWRIGLRLGG